jgi:hypothetical protein
MKSIRETFLPDEGCVFVRADLSQVEDRVGKMYCGSPRMVELANRKPWEYDAHTENAKDIFGKNEIDKTERYLGKKCVHASWRQMAGDKMSESVSKDTDGKLFIPPKKCQQLIDAYLAKNPEIEEIYFPFCEQQIKDVGVCYNSWGRPFDVRDLRHDAELNRKVYSFYPQSECCSGDTEVLTKRGWIRFDEYNEEDPIATSNMEGTIIFDRPTRLIKKKVGKMIHFEGTRVSQFVTPTHKMLYITNGIPKVKMAVEIKDYKRPQFWSCGKYNQGNFYLNKAEIALLCALQADSYIRGNSITWHFSKKRKIVRLCKTLEELKIKYSHMIQKDGTFTAYTHLKRIPHQIKGFLVNKKFQLLSLLDLNLETLRGFVEELKYWDGSKPKSNPNSFWFDSSIRKNSETVQAIACLSGFRATLKKFDQGEHRSIWRVYISRQNKAIPSKVIEIEGEFDVYCVTVPWGYFLIRHNGKVSITGNCADWTNMYGVLPGHYYMWARYGKPLNMQIHDEIVASVPLEEAWDFAVYIKQAIEQTREIPAKSGLYLTVPTEITIGTSLYGGVEFEDLPGKEAFIEKAKEGLGL